MTKTSEWIAYHLSYGINDMAVTAEEERKIIALFSADTDASQTVLDLDSGGWMYKLFDRVDTGENLMELVQVMGGAITSPAAAAVVIKQLRRFTSMTILPSVHGMTWFAQNYVHMFSLCFELQTALRNAPGGRPLGAGLDLSLLALAAKLAGSGSQPFSGVGASGRDPRSRSIPVTDQWNLKWKDPATTRRYSNPIPGSLPGYLAGLTADERKDQAKLLLKQPIFSVLRQSYLAGLPRRSAIMMMAGKAHRLEPALVAAFVLAEQRDQSELEDAKDFQAAALALSQANTSIGLGQVVVSTARRNDLFADVLQPATRKALEHTQIAHLLASDEFNIFAVARYIRQVADDATRFSAEMLPNTVAKFTKVDFTAFGRESNLWPDDNIRALGSEYTSRAWDDNLSPGWGDFVFEAYRDIKASGVL